MYNTYKSQYEVKMSVKSKRIALYPVGTILHGLELIKPPFYKFYVPTQHNKVHVEVKCRYCNTIKIILLDNFGKTKSCGCKLEEHKRNFGKENGCGYNRKGTLVDKEGYKICSMCLQKQPCANFTKLSKTKDKLNTYCKKCRVNNDLLRDYKITVIEYQAILSKQDYRCACCKIHINEYGQNFHVDHHHDSGKIRGLLCFNCNAGIGSLGDTIEGVLQAYNYLKNCEESLLTNALVSDSMNSSDNTTQKEIQNDSSRAKDGCGQVCSV